MQVCRENALAIVIVDSPLIEHRMADPQIEEAGITAAGAAALDSWDVGHAMRIGKHLHDWTVDDETVQIPFFM